MQSELVIVGLSGGVDSSVAALQLLEQGYRVEALFMFNWAEDESGYCTAADDFQSARKVADALGIPLHQADFSREYRDQVFREFLSELDAGRTPNPDLLCNRHIKFDAFLTHAQRLGASRIATGHYARTDGERLLRARDLNKDQSYFLALIQKAALKHCLFPLGELTKPEVRQHAEQSGLPTFDRPDSTGICFIGERPFRDFIAEYLPPDSPASQPGDIVNIETAQTIGRHTGLGGYTLGQRRGLGIGGQKDAADAPWYVVAKDLAARQLLVSQNPRHPALLRQQIELRSPCWLRMPEPDTCLLVQYRHRQKPVPATATCSPEGATIRFLQPQAAVTPGQYAALYREDECLGAGIIC